MSQKRQPLPLSVLLPYKGGHTVVYGGYVFELCPDHPKANPFGFVPQHRLVVERRDGEYLQQGNMVHHLDECKTSNHPDNLLVCTRSEHMRLHRETNRAKKMAPITAGSVRDALDQTGSLKKAAKLLHVHSQTLRNRYPELVEPYKRKSPTKIDDPHVIEIIAGCAASDQFGYRETAEKTGICYMSVVRICRQNGIEWIKKTRKGEIHRTYRRKKPSQ